MRTAKRKRVDSLERAIEAALDDGNFISYKAAWAFVDGLQDVANRVGEAVEVRSKFDAAPVNDYTAATMGARGYRFGCRTQY